MLNVQDLIREWCALSGYPLPDLTGRARAAREAGLLSQGSYGRHAPAGTAKDGAALLLAPCVGEHWKHVPEGIRRYGGLELARALSLSTKTECDPPFGLQSGMTLLDSLTRCLERCGIQTENPIFLILPDILQVVRSETDPRATLSLHYSDGRPEPFEAVSISFREPRLPLEDRPVEAFTIAAQLHKVALTAMVQLLAANIHAQNETGPSAGTDEPGSMIPTLIDRRRGPTRKRHTGLQNL
jgi:hypothetical protein